MILSKKESGLVKTICNNCGAENITKFDECFSWWGHNNERYYNIWHCCIACWKCKAGLNVWIKEN